MKKDIDVICQAIRLADLDGLKSLEIGMEDLRVMMSYMSSLEDDLESFEYKVRMINLSLAKSELRSIEKCATLDMYC